MTGKYYILEGKIPKVIEDVIVWAKWFEKADRHVAETNLTNGVRVSTVFLGLDHSFGGNIPILFETMVFGKNDIDDYQERYKTYLEAEEGHARTVKMIQTKLKEELWQKK